MRRSALAMRAVLSQLGAAGFLLAVVVRTAAAAGLFASHDLFFDDQPRHVSVGDLNGDGRSDLVFTTQTQVFVLASVGDGTFVETYRTMPSVIPNSTFLDDLDEDGKLDCIVVNREMGTLSLYYGQGDGTLQSRRSLRNFPRGSATCVAVEDFDDDGDRDIVLGYSDLNAITYFLAESDGTYAALNRNRARAAVAMRVLELNDDAIPDLVISDGVETQLVRLNGFLNGTVIGQLAPAAEGGLVLADLDADGLDDVVIGGRNGIVVYLGLAAGGLAAPVTYPGAAFGRIVASDVDSDGHQDIVSQAVEFAVWRGLGDGTLVERTRGRALARWVGVADFDGEHGADLVFAGGETENVSSLACVLFANEDGSYGGDRRSDAPCGAKFSSRIDGDAYHDLLAVQPGDGRIEVLLGAPHGAFQPRTPLVDFSCGLAAAHVGDFDGDGNADLVASRPSYDAAAPTPPYEPIQVPCYTLDVLLGDGLGGFAPRVTSSPMSEPDIGAAGDLNGDGRTDLLFQRHTTFADSFVVQLANGDGTFRVGFGVGGMPYAAQRVADVDGDGNHDLVATRPGIELAVLPGDGSGRLGSPIVTPMASRAASAPELADLNSDGKLDLVYLAGATETEIVSQLGDGAGGFGATRSLLVYGWGDVVDLALADLDHDGDIDAVATATRPVQSALVFLGDGSGTFAFEGRYSLDGEQRIEAFDVTGDGNADLVALGSDCRIDVLVNQLPPVPVTVEALTASRSGGRAEVSWSLARSALATLRSVAVERSGAAAGPWSVVSPLLAPQQQMTFADLDAPADASSWYRLRLVDTGGEVVWSAAVEALVAGVARTEFVGHSTRGAGGAIEFRYRIASPGGTARLALYDVAGRRVWSGPRRALVAGEHVEACDVTAAGSRPVVRGVYFALLDVDGLRLSRKVVLDSRPGASR